ncbi:MAG: acylphosphatase, partial [Candidatus Micrarchaeota archaeon]|nr:acylphosphatase [Candidatus Micrarchaeota archaeon]
ICRNEPQGVKVFLDGDKAAIEKFLETVKSVKPSGFFGPNVERVEIYWEGEKNFEPAWRSYEGFEVDY